MAKYRVVKSYWGPCVVERDDGSTIRTSKWIDIGTEFEFDGVPGDNLEPLDAAAKKAFKKRDEDRAKKSMKQSLPASIDIDALVAEKVAAKLAELNVNLQG